MITKEELTVLSRQYAVKQAEQGDEFISAGKGFLAGFNAGINEMRAENEKLRDALEAIIDRYDVANMLAGDDPVIKKARSLL